MQPNKISDRWKINILQDEGVPKVFSKFPMEFSGGPLDFTAIGLCVVKCPLIINITLQAHAGRFGIILLYIIVTTHCPSSTARAPHIFANSIRSTLRPSHQIRSIMGPATRPNFIHQIPATYFVIFFLLFFIVFFLPLPLRWWGQSAFTKARGCWAWIIDPSITLCRVFLWSLKGGRRKLGPIWQGKE